MDERLRDKVIVITGASSGFGKGAALKFAHQGARLVLAARRENLLQEIVLECQNAGAQALAVPTNVSLIRDVKNLAQAALRKLGRIDVWINNAGVAAVGCFTDIPLTEHVQVIETDLIGTLLGSYCALEQFRTQQSGTLINVASMIGKVPAPYYASYAAAKHGVVGLGAALRQELKAQKLDNIHVCTVMPMAMDTPFFEHSANYSGRETVPIPPIDDAQKVIDELVALVLNPKDEVPVGIGSASNLLLHNVAPALSEALMGQVTHKAQMEDARPSGPTDGTVTTPGIEGVGIKDARFAKR